MGAVCVCVYNTLYILCTVYYGCSAVCPWSPYVMLCPTFVEEKSENLQSFFYWTLTLLGTTVECFQFQYHAEWVFLSKMLNLFIFKIMFWTCCTADCVISEKWAYLQIVLEQATHGIAREKYLPAPSMNNVNVNILYPSRVQYIQAQCFRQHFRLSICFHFCWAWQILRRAGLSMFVMTL